MKKLRPILFAALLLSPTLSFAWCDNCNGGDCCACPGQAQCLGSYSTCEEACGGGGGRSSAPAYDPQAAAARAAALAERQGLAHNQTGVDYYNRGDFESAIKFFENSLLYTPGDPTYTQNLVNARQALRNAKDQEAARQENLRQNAAAVERMGQVTGTLNFDGGTGGTSPGTVGGLDFMAAIPSTGAAGAAGAQVAYPPHGDPRIVDARNLPPAVSKDIDRAIKGAYPNASPEVVERLKKAFTAVENRDWKVAKAWFQDALKRDPTNAGLQRFVILTQDPADLKKVQAPPAPPPPLVRPIKPPPAPKAPNNDIMQFFKNFRDGVQQNPKPEVREFVLSLSPDSFKYLLVLQLPEERDIAFLFDTTPAAALQLPMDEDLAFLFDPPTAPAPKAPQLKPLGKN